MRISIEEYRLIAAGWLLLIVFLTVFWYATLKKLSQVLQERLNSAASRRALSGLLGMVRFIFRAEYRDTGDKQLVGVCNRLRQLLYGYIGGIGAYLVFLVVMRPH